MKECDKEGQLNEFLKELLGDVVMTMLESLLPVEKEFARSVWEAGMKSTVENSSIGYEAAEDFRFVEFDYSAIEKDLIDYFSQFYNDKTESK